MLLLVLHCQALPALGTTTLEDLQTIFGLTPFKVSVKTETPAPAKLVKHVRRILEKGACEGKLTMKRPKVKVKPLE